MNEIHGKAPLNNSAKWGRGGALAIGTMTSQSTPQPITGPLLARAPGLQPRLAQWLMRPWVYDLRCFSALLSLAFDCFLPEFCISGCSFHPQEKSQVKDSPFPALSQPFSMQKCALLFLEGS